MCSSGRNVLFLNCFDVEVKDEETSFEQFVASDLLNESVRIFWEDNDCWYNKHFCFCFHSSNTVDIYLTESIDKMFCF